MRALFVLLACCSLFGQTQRTRILDTVYNADGSRARGSVRITLWRPALSESDEYVAASSRTIWLKNGVIDVELVPNDTLKPAGSFYYVSYALANSPSGWSEAWIVPASSSPLRISDVLAEAPSGWSGYLSSRPIRQVSSLPSSCKPGEYVHLSSAPPGRNTYACVAPDTWALQGDGGGTNQQVYDVRDYGARCNGSSDDTQAIQAAINAAPQGAIVFFPTGYCLVSSPLSVTKGLHFRGSGRHTVISTLNSSNASIFVVNTDESVQFEDMTLGGPETATTGALIWITGPGYYGNSASFIKNVRFWGGTSHIVAPKSIGLHIQDSRFTNWGGYAIWADHEDADTGGVWCYKCSFTWARVGSPGTVYAGNAIGTRIEGSDFLNVPVALEVNRTSTVGSYLLEFRGNMIDGILGSSAVRVSVPSGGAYWHATISQNNIAAGGSSVSNARLIEVLGGAFGFNISNNNLSCRGGVQQTGIYVATQRGGHNITGNTIINCAVGVNASSSVTTDTTLVAKNTYQWLSGPAVVANSGVMVDEQYRYMAYSELPGAMNGSSVYCYNCKRTNPCSAGGTGAFARRVGDQWLCGVSEEVWDAGGAVFNVKAFGAKGDLSDDTQAIQNAINAAIAARGTLYFPPGNYLVSSTLTVNGDLVVKGAGWTVATGQGAACSSAIHRSGVNSDLFQVVGGRQFSISEICLMRAAAGDTSGAAVRVSLSSGQLNRLTADRVFIMHFTHGFYNQSANITEITGSTIARGGASTAGYALHVSNNVNSDACETSFLDNTVNSMARVVNANCFSLYVRGNKVWNADWAVYAQNTQNNSGQIIIEGNRFDGGGERMLIAGSASATLTSVIISNNFFASDVFPEYIIRLNQYVSSSTITGNVIVASGATTMIDIQGGDFHVVSGNRIGYGMNNSVYGVNMQGGGLLSSNAVDGTFTTPLAAGSSTVVLPQGRGVPFNQLGAWANGSMVYCTNCQIGATCSGGGTGAFARRINGAWNCQ